MLAKHHSALLLLNSLLSLIVFVLVAFAITRIITQYRTDSFATTPAEIDYIQENATSNSAATDNPSSTDFSIDVRYHYVADGQRHDSTRLRYGAVSGSHAWASDIIRQFPSGSNRVAYYDPKDPGASVLIRGFQSADSLPLILLIPPAFVALLLWVTLYYTLRVKTRFAGLDILQEAEITRIRPARLTAYAAGALFIAAADIAGLLLLWLASGTHPSTRFALGLTIVATLPGLLITVVRLFQINAGKRDIVLDATQKLVTAAIPKKVEIACKSLLGVHIVESEKVRIRGQPLLSVIIRHKVPDATPPQQNLPVKSLIFDPEAADRLAIYLARQLKIPAYTAANTRLLDPEAPKKTAAATQPPVRPVFSNPYKPFKPTRRPPR